MVERLCLSSAMTVQKLLALALLLWVGGGRVVAANEVVVKDDSFHPATGTALAQPPATLTRMGTRMAWPAGARSPQLLWTGFRTTRTGGQIVIQTSGSVELEARSPANSPAVKERGNGLLFVLKRCRSVRRTDRLPLETRFFDSTVTRVAINQRAADLEVRVSLREPVNAMTRQEAGPDGSWFWIIDFPTPSAALTTAAVDVPGPAPSGGGVVAHSAAR